MGHQQCQCRCQLWIYIMHSHKASHEFDHAESLITSYRPWANHKKAHRPNMNRWWCSMNSQWYSGRCQQEMSEIGVKHSLWTTNIDTQFHRDCTVLADSVWLLSTDCGDCILINCHQLCWSSYILDEMQQASAKSR